MSIYHLGKGTVSNIFITPISLSYTIDNEDCMPLNNKPFLTNQELYTQNNLYFELDKSLLNLGLFLLAEPTPAANTNNQRAGLTIAENNLPF